MSTKRINPPLEPILTRLEKFWLYETNTMYYLVGFDMLETDFRMLKINRTRSTAQDLSEIVYEDPLSYTRSEVGEILEMVNEGNRASGGLVKVCTAYGLVGFVKFLDCFYFTLITQRKEVGCIGGNFIYTIKATEMFSVKQPDSGNKNMFTKIWNKVNKKINQTSAEIAESRYMGLFQFVDMTKDFFFSYSYDLTHSMQRNYIVSMNRANLNFAELTKSQEIFEWNHFQTEKLKEITMNEEGAMSSWILPVIHGSYQQKRFSLFGKIVDMSLIARRSRHYAGTRYLKRGISVHGKVANDCEIEQIIQHEIRNETSFCSYVQVRGSIPTYWYQETSVTMPKPPILINRVDPDYLATGEHFVDLMTRYSAPIIVLDLVKHHEKRPRESLVGKEFQQAVNALNDSMPAERKILYIALDYSKITSISKGKNKGGGAGSNSSSKTLAGGAAMGVAGSEWANMAVSLEQQTASSHNPSTPASKASGGAIPGGARAAAGEQHRDSGSGTNSQALLSTHNNNNNDNNNNGIGTSTTGGGGGGATTEGGTGPTIDVLRELEDIAKLTLYETGFFCNTLQHIDRVKLISPERVEQASTRSAALSAAGIAGGRGKSTEYIEQRGVLRTNCIDCLDRTNGGQFAVAMKFLSVSLKALGLPVSANGSGNVDATSPLLHGLMDMFGEMGDKIALQYGGSEAHKKVITGKGVQSTAKASASKQGELLTSMKRYYSNAFTDMMKQDAMNVFLGCYVPSQEPQAMPLWDLESDYHLHNHKLRPTEPLSNKIMFNDVPLESKKLLNPKIKLMTENAIKTVLNPENKEVVVDIFGFPVGRSSSSYTYATEGLVTSSNQDTAAAAAAAPLPPSSPSRSQDTSRPRSFTAAGAGNGAISDLDSQQPEIAFIKSLPHIPKIDVQSVLSKYFIRNLDCSTGDRGAIVTAGEGEGTEASRGANSEDGGDSGAVLSLEHPKNIASSGVTNKGMINNSCDISFRTKGAHASAVRFIARCEKRKLIRKIMYKKISQATESWWREALLAHDRNLYGSINVFRKQAPVSAGTRRANFKQSHQSHSSRGRSVTASPQLQKEQQLQLQHQQSYFDRVYIPQMLTEFDHLLNLVFFAPIDASSNKQQIGANSSFNNSESAQQRFASMESIAEPRPTTTPGAPTEAVLAVTNAGGGGGRGDSSGNNLPPHAPATPNPHSLHAHSRVLSGDNEYKFHPPPYRNNSKGSDDGGVAHGEMGFEAHGMGNGPNASGGWFVTKFAREMGQKARSLVGGLIRKDDHITSALSPSKSVRVAGETQPDWNQKYQQISQNQHSVSRESSALYNRYVQVAENNLLLLNDRNNPRYLKALNAEYKSLLREYCVEVDHVADMEHLAAESHVSSRINSGIYQGMKQTESAIMAHAFLYENLVFIEELLQQYGVHVDPAELNSFSGRDAFHSGYGGFISTTSNSGGSGYTRGAGTLAAGSSSATASLFLTPNSSSSYYSSLPSPSTIAAPYAAAATVPSTPYSVLLKSNTVKGSHTTTALTNSLRRANSSLHNLQQHPQQGYSSIGGGGAAAAAGASGGSTPGGNTGGVNNSTSLLDAQAKQLRQQADQRLALQQQQNQLLKNSLTLDTYTQNRLRYLQTRGRGNWPSAVGMEAEFRKIVSNYVFQKFSYAKEISSERLARRMSTLTSERTVVRYIHLLDRDQMASAVDELLFTACDSTAYQTFHNLHSICDNLEPVLARIRDRQIEIELEKLEKERAKESVAASTDSSSSSSNRSSVSQSLGLGEGPTALEQTEFDKYSSAQFSSSNSSSSANNTNAQSDTGAVSDNIDLYNMHFQYDIHRRTASLRRTDSTRLVVNTATATPGSSSGGGTRGRSIPAAIPAGALSSHSIDEYESFLPASGGGGTDTAVVASSTARNDDSYFASAASVAASSMLELEPVSPVLVDDSSYTGFSTVAPDIFTRATNPHLQINEIGVIRFNQMLSSST